MKHFFIDPPGAAVLVAGNRVQIQETEDVDDLDAPGRIYLGSTDNDGNVTTALVEPQLPAFHEIGLSSVRMSQFFKATAIDNGRHVPVLVNADHVGWARPAKSGSDETHIRMSDGAEYTLADHFDTIAKELFGEDASSDARDVPADA